MTKPQIIEREKENSMLLPAISSDFSVSFFGSNFIRVLFILTLSILNGCKFLQLLFSDKVALNPKSLGELATYEYKIPFIIIIIIYIMLFYTLNLNF